MTPHTQAAFVTSFVDREGRQPTQQEVWDAAIRSYRDLAQPASIKERWNIERDGDALLVCFNDHEKGEACRYERFVPEAQPAQADQSPAEGDEPAWKLPTPAVGDYVLATKWNDGDPGDNWALGFYTHSDTLQGNEQTRRYYVADSAGNNIRGNGFRKVHGPIRGDVGRWLLEVASKPLEASPPGVVNLWTMLTPTAFDLERDRERAAIASQVQPKRTALAGTPPRVDYVKVARVYALAYGLHDDAPSYLPRTPEESDAFEPHSWVIGAMMQAFGDGWADGHAAGMAVMKEAAKRQLNLNDPSVQKRLAAQWGYVQAPAPAPAEPAGDLLPCPFCGGDVDIACVELMSSRDGGPVYVHCDICGADGPQHDWADDAKADWNRRTQSTTAVEAAPQPEAQPTNRCEFEVHAAERGFELERYPQGPYVSFNTDKHWETWRAALAAPSAQPEAQPVPAAWIRWEWNRSGSKSLVFDKPAQLSLSEEARGVVYSPLYAAPSAQAEQATSSNGEDYKQAHGAKNCMQCAAACMLGLPLSSVPDFEKAGPDAWESFYAFFAKHGFTAEMFPPRVEIEGDYLASGTTERGTNHMVVMRNGTLLHDPHPSNAGLTSLQVVWVIARKAQAEQKGGE